MKKIIIYLFTLAAGCSGATAQTYVHNNQEIIDIPYKPGATTKAILYLPKNITGKVPIWYYWYGLGHDAWQGTETLFSQGLPLEISNGWQPPFAVLAIQTPAEAGNANWSGYFYSSNPWYMESIKTWAINNLLVDINQMYDMGISAGGGAITAYSGSVNFTPKYKMAGIFCMSGTIASYGSAYDPKLVDPSKFKNIPFYGGGSLLQGTDDIQGAITKSLVDAIAGIGGTTNFVDTKSPTHSNWEQLYLPTSPVWSWFASKSGNVINPPVVTPPVIIPPVTQPTNTAHKWYPTGGNLNSLGVQPGDTVFLNSQITYSWVTLQNFQGDPNNPVVITYYNGRVTLTSASSLSGFNFDGSVGIKVDGMGAGNTYNFYVTATTQSGAGVSVANNAAYIEVCGVEIYNKNEGFFIKTEQSCTSSNSFPATMHHFKLHDNYIHHIGNEGMYNGSTAQNAGASVNNQHPVTLCLNSAIVPAGTANSIASTLSPMRTGYFEIYNNRIDDCGSSAILMNGHDSGFAYVHDNLITNIGTKYNSSPSANGIAAGSYTDAIIKRNVIIHTWNQGIFSTGCNITIDSNYVDSSGYLYGQVHLPSNGNEGQSSIWVNTAWGGLTNAQHGNYDSTRFKITNNFAGLNTQNAIEILDANNGIVKNGNLIANNITGPGTLAVANGINYSTSFTPPVITPPIITPPVNNIFDTIPAHQELSVSKADTLYNAAWQPLKSFQNVYRISSYINSKNRIQFLIYYYTNKTKAFTVGVGKIN